MVFVLDCGKVPLDPCHPARARQLLKAGKAAVFKRYPFTIILKTRKVEDSVVHPFRLKIDPGSKVTGMAIVNDATNNVVFGAEIQHRGWLISDRMRKRRIVRRGRRRRHCRHREKRIWNRHRRQGWLPPSLMSRVQNIGTWVSRFSSLCPLTALSLESVKFDMQKMQNPEITGIEYQQGELQGYEVREYLLEKWGRKCAYCGKENIPLQIEHIVPKARGGTNQVVNLSLACESCNKTKGTKTATEFGHPEIQAKAKRPLKDAAAVNITRNAVCRELESSGLPLELGSGAQTKYNRTVLKLPKQHWLDAACVGDSGRRITANYIGFAILQIRAMGHGRRQMCHVDKYGFPRSRPKQGKYNHGFQTGDIAVAVCPKGKNKGVQRGRVVIASDGRFSIGKAQHIQWKRCRLLQHADGYEYSHRWATVNR